MGAPALAPEPLSPPPAPQQENVVLPALRADLIVSQQIYEEQTEPLIDVYRRRGLLIEVDGMGDVDEVTQRIFDALASVIES